jgi:dephospho-CoA kinase
VFYGFSWVRTRDVIHDLLSEDLRLPRAKRRFGIDVPDGRIAETHLRLCGGIILNTFEQKPLIAKLEALLSASHGPVVVDAIRELKDVSKAKLRNRSVVTWFIDCSDHLLGERRSKRSKLGEGRSEEPSPVDRTALALRALSDLVLSNNGTLEELRWQIEDAIWSMSELSAV